MCTASSNPAADASRLEFLRAVSYTAKTFFRVSASSRSWFRSRKSLMVNFRRVRLLEMSTDQRLTKVSRLSKLLSLNESYLMVLHTLVVSARISRFRSLMLRVSASSSFMLVFLDRDCTTTVHHVCRVLITTAAPDPVLI